MEKKTQKFTKTEAKQIIVNKVLSSQGMKETDAVSCKNILDLINGRCILDLVKDNHIVEIMRDGHNIFNLIAELIVES